jgi:predicted ATPase
MIKRIEIKGLHNKWDHDIKFHDDISLLTGRNGAGKTAVIKLAWYLMSGNIERTIREVNFTSAKVVTDKCSVSVTCDGQEPTSKVNVEAHVLENDEPMKLTLLRQEWGVRDREIDVINGHVARATGSSLFFPTFRRIEGGFATSRDLVQPRRMHAVHELTHALDNYVESISVCDHHFVATLSTHDVHALLTEKYADASRKTDSIHRNLYSNLKSLIESFTKSQAAKKPAPGRYKKTLSELTKVLEAAEKDRTAALARFTQLSSIITSIFTHKGIQLTNTVTFGDPINAVRSDLLSAGEKQFLSFLCYNAFLSNSVVIIDEPEISLHPDWQRRLIPTLKSQNSANQFILTTHSPFIYSKYPEREICLSDDKGE